MTPAMMAREHMAWCLVREMSEEDVCESIRVYQIKPTWQFVFAMLERRSAEMIGGMYGQDPQK